MTDTTGLLGTPYALGGRKPGVAIDCLGTTLELARRMGLCAPDPWLQIEHAWRARAMDSFTGFPRCWGRLCEAEPSRIRDGDVLLSFAPRPWAAIVCDGHVWSASLEVGSVFCVPLLRWHAPPAEVWRHDPGSCSARPAG